MNEPRLFFPLLLPTFVLLSAFGMPGLDASRQYEQVFGSGNYYFSARFARDPQVSEASLVFQGALVTPFGEFPAHGKRHQKSGRWEYHFQTAEGDWTGVLSDSGKCPRWLDLTPVSTPSGLYQPERLRAGECPLL